MGVGRVEHSRLSNSLQWIEKKVTMENTASSILTDLSPSRLASAVEASIAAAVPVFGIADEFRHEDPPGVKLALTMIPGGPYVSVAGAKFEPGKADASIERILAEYRAVPIDWWVGPESKPVDLGEKLLARGFKLIGSSSGCPGRTIHPDRPDHTPCPRRRGLAAVDRGLPACLGV